MSPDALKGKLPGSRCLIHIGTEGGLPAPVLEAARTEDIVREGYYGGAWFAHRHAAKVVHVEARGPAFKGSLRGGSKALFCLPGA